MPEVKFKGCARFIDDEMVCFCYERDVKANLCKCKKKFDLPECIITIEKIKGTCPSQQEFKPSEVKNPAVERNLRKLATQSQEIKRSLQSLEKAVKNRRFRI